MHQIFKINLISKKHKAKNVNIPIRIYINKIENRIPFRIETGYYLKLLTTEKIKLLRSTKIKMTKDKNDEITEVVLVHCNILSNNYQRNSRILYPFIPNKSFGQLIDLSTEIFKFIKAFKSEFSYIEVWFTDQNSNLPEIEGKINIILVINSSVRYDVTRCSV